MRRKCILFKTFLCYDWDGEECIIAIMHSYFNNNTYPPSTKKDKGDKDQKQDHHFAGFDERDQMRICLNINKFNFFN